MSKANDVLDEIGPQFRTNVRSVKDNLGTRNIRNQVEGALKHTCNMLNKEHPSPNPKSVEDEKMLKEVCNGLEKCIAKLRTIKDSKKGIKY